MQSVQQFDGSHIVLVNVTSHKIIFAHTELLNDIDIAHCCYVDVSRATASRKNQSSNIPHTEHIVCVAARQAFDRQQSGDIIPHAVKRSLALLMMGKELPEIC